MFSNNNFQFLNTCTKRALSFLKKHFFIMHFLKTQLFQKAQLQKVEPNSPLVELKLLQVICNRNVVLEPRRKKKINLKRWAKTIAEGPKS